MMGSYVLCCAACAVSCCAVEVDKGSRWGLVEEFEESEEEEESDEEEQEEEGKDATLTAHQKESQLTVLVVATSVSLFLLGSTHLWPSAQGLTCPMAPWRQGSEALLVAGWHMQQHYQKRVRCGRGSGSW